MDSLNKKAGMGFVRTLIFRYAIFIILAVLVIGLTILRPNFFSFSNTINILRQVSVNGILSLGMTLIIITGGIDLSPGSVLALTGVTGAMFAYEGMPIIVAIIVACFVGAAAGFVSGFIISATGIPPFIATLGIQQAARGLALILTNGAPVGDMSESFLYIGKGNLFDTIPISVVVFIALAVFCYLLLNRTKLGKHIYAIGGNEQAAVVCGINTKKVKMIVYSLAGVLVGIAAIIAVSRNNTANPSIGEGFEFDAITATVIGGASLNGGLGSVGGTVVGVLIIGVLNAGLTFLGVSPYWQTLVKGALIVGAVVLDTYKGKLLRA